MSTEEYNENDEFEPQDSYESDYEEEDEKPRKSSRVVLIIAVAALIGLNLFLGWNIYSQTEKLKEKEAEIAALDSQRVMLLAKVDSLTTHVATLTTDAAEKDSSLANLRTELETLKAQLTDKDKYIATLEDYKRKYKDYLHFKNLAAEKEEEIEQLKAEKKAAIARAQEAENANDTLTQRLNEINDVREQLENKVSLGKRLTGSVKEIISWGERRGKQRETDKASQVGKFQVKYSIAANAIADKGNKTVYIIVKTGSKTITEEGLEFEIDGGKKLSYTHKDEIKYNGKDTDSSPSFNLPGVITSGNYNVEVYVDGKLLGTNEITLR